MENCEIVIFQNGESVSACFRLGLNLVHVDVSLPGTPLSSDVSGRSSRSAVSVTATTPTYIRLEEGTGPTTVTTIPT